MSIGRWMGKHILLCPYNETLLNNEMKWTSICKDSNGSQNYHTKWKKQDYTRVNSTWSYLHKILDNTTNL